MITIGQVIKGLLIVETWQEWNGRQWKGKFKAICINCGKETIIWRGAVERKRQKYCQKCVLTSQNHLRLLSEHRHIGLKHGEVRTPLYVTWVSMRCRCAPHQVNTAVKRRYYGRGITVCDEWSNYLTFKLWAQANGYVKGLCLDRRDNNKGYSPDNCRFITSKQNSRNTTRNVNITIDGDTRCASEWAELTGTSVTKIRDRLFCGWAPKEAVYGRDYEP